MKKITPWSKEVELIFESLAKNGRAYINDISISRNMGKKYPELFDVQEGFMDIGRIDRIKKSVIVPRIGVHIVPLPEPDSESIKIRRKRKYGIYRV